MLVFGYELAAAGAKKAKWAVLDKRYWPGENFADHLLFALRHEDLDLLILKRVFDAVPTAEFEALVRGEFPRQDRLTGLEFRKPLIRRRLAFRKVQCGRPWKRVQNGLFHSLSLWEVDRASACYDCSISCYGTADHLADQ